MIQVVLFILILTTIIKIGFDNIIDDDISYATSFIILLFVYNLIKFINSNINFRFDIFDIILITIIVIDAIFIIIRKKIKYQNFRYIWITFITCIAC